MVRYTITAIKKDGLRHLAFDNNHFSNYLTKEEADEKLKAIQGANSAESIAEMIGSDLKVLPVIAYSSGDAVGTIINEDDKLRQKEIDAFALAQSNGHLSTSEHEGNFAGLFTFHGINESQKWNTYLFRHSLTGGFRNMNIEKETGILMLG